MINRQLSFSAGEIAPALQARVDLVKYATGLKTCRNWIVKKQGGVENRPGTEFVGEVRDSTKKVRLIPFIFNADQSYVLEFSQAGSNGLYMRPWFNGALIYDLTGNITAITNASSAVLTIVGHGLSNNDEVYVSGVGGMTEINSQHYTVIVVSANTIRLRRKDDTVGSGTIVDSSAFGVYTSGGTVQRVHQVLLTITDFDSEDYLKDIRFAQNGDTMALALNPFFPLEVRRVAHDSWTLTSFDFGLGIEIPLILSISGGGGAGAFSESYVATAVHKDTGEESLVSAVETDSKNTAPSATVPWFIEVNNSTSPEHAKTLEYRIYKLSNGVYGFIGSIAAASTWSNVLFTDDGIDPDFLDTPPIDRDLFTDTGNRPTAVAFYQQALLFANSDNAPERAWKSRTGAIRNFTTRSPLKDDDSFSFQLFGDQINPIQHMTQLKKLLALTLGGEWSIEGDESGTLRPTAINPRQHSYNGARTIRPIIANDTVLYVQRGARIIRDLSASVEKDGYSGDDITIFSSHLFKRKAVVDWDYQKNPHSIVWVVLDDGGLLGVTFDLSHQIIGWHRHDFENGTVENVCVIPEDDEDVVYLAIKRTIDGVTKRYIERFARRDFENLEDYKIMDSCLSYDGWNTDDANTVGLNSLGTQLTYYAGPFFTVDDIGNQMYIVGSDGQMVKFAITGFTSDQVVTGTVDRTIPSSVAFPNLLSNWAKAVDEISNLHHLEGEAVSVLGDGFVIASPNNSQNDDLEELTVTDGAITLSTPRAVIHVGLPITADIETLDIESPEAVLADKKKNVTEVFIHVEESAPAWVGGEEPAGADALDSMEKMDEIEVEASTEDEAAALQTDVIEQKIESHWSKGGRIFIRQVDPVPTTILSIMPSGYLGMGRTRG